MSTGSKKKVKVAVYSSSLEENVSGLIKEIQDKMSEDVEDVKFVQLPYNIRDMNQMKLEKSYHMLLCHSINNRRFSVTNVTDALYDDFLRKAKKTLDRRRIGVIAHDFETTELTQERIASRMESFKNTQERTFRKSNLQLIGGQMSEGPVELNEAQWETLKKFLKNQLNTPKPKKPKKESTGTPCLCGRGSPTDD